MVAWRGQLRLTSSGSTDVYAELGGLADGRRKSQQTVALLDEWCKLKTQRRKDN